MNNRKIVNIVNNHIIGHTRGCIYGSYGEVGDFCDCNRYQRKIDLYNDIAEFGKLPSYAKSADKKKDKV